MNEPLDNLVARCQQLPDEDFSALFSALMREQKERDCREQKAAWQKVVEALTLYLKDYGDVIITDNRDGDGIVLSHGYWVDTLGLIEVE